MTVSDSERALDLLAPIDEERNGGGPRERGGRDEDAKQRQEAAPVLVLAIKLFGKTMRIRDCKKSSRPE